MSTYATSSDFDQWGIAPAALPVSVTAGNKDAACSAASTKADGYLGARFRMPLVSWGDDLRQAVCAIAAFDLVSTQVGFNPEVGQNLVLVTRKDDALRWLEQVSRGHVNPASIVDTSPSAPSVSRVTSNARRGW